MPSYVRAGIRKCARIRALSTQLEELRKAIAYIDEKQRFYADVTAGRTAYCSNVIDTTQSD